MLQFQLWILENSPEWLLSTMQCACFAIAVGLSFLAGYLTGRTKNPHSDTES